MITFRPIDQGNRAEVEALRVAPDQEAFVSGVAASMQEALDEARAHPIQWAIYDGDAPVGFVMVADEVDGEDYIAQYLWRLLIDRDHQRKGYGTDALRFVSGFFRERGREVMWTSAGRGEGSPIPFYERFGFVQTGEIRFDDEMVLRLDLR